MLNFFYTAYFKYKFFKVSISTTAAKPRFVRCVWKSSSCNCMYYRQPQSDASAELMGGRNSWATVEEGTGQNSFRNTALCYCESHCTETQGDVYSIYLGS